MTPGKLDRERSFGTIAGHAVAAYEQDGLLYAGDDSLIGSPKTVSESLPVRTGAVIQTDSLVSAKAFLKQVLAGSALPKSTLYSLAENNNQNWGSVKDAAADLNIIKFMYQKSETWRLPEESNS